MALLLLAASICACGGADETATTAGGEPASEPANGEPASGSASLDGTSGADAAGTRPNIVLIVADDLGFSDVGAFGGEIPTPNIDALAESGMMLTQFYANMACSPTRAMLLSGTDSHVAGLGVMSARSDGPQAGAPGYEGYLNFRVASLANLLKDAGYHTYMTGKWHLGRDLETGPRARGFEESFVSIDGAAHLGGLSWNGPGLAPYRDGEEMVTVGDDFYSTEFYTERMIEYIERHRGDGRPFFSYLAYTAPHWPLQAPPESIAKFEGWYDDGYEALHRRRLERSKELGLIPEQFTAEGPVAGQPAWDQLSDEERRFAARRMEIYAAMVSDLDTYIGHFVDYLESTGALDDAFILFISDNGAEANRLDLAPRMQDWLATCCDNSYENLGAGDSYVMYGPNWARAGAAPYRRHKATAFEGGIHVPAIARFPGHVPAGTRSDVVGTVMDVLPTFLGLAGTEPPDGTDRGREVAPIQGRSLLPELTRTGSLDDERHFFGWELYGHRAIRQGDWKIVWDARGPQEGRDWELFNLAEDPAEQLDLAAREPERFAAMNRLWDEYAARNGVILDGGAPAAYSNAAGEERGADDE